MSNPLTFLLPLNGSQVKDILIIQTRHLDLLNTVIQKCKEVFPEAYIEAVVREPDIDMVNGVERLQVYPVRWEEGQALWEQRRELRQRFRHKKYDAIVVQLPGEGGAKYLKVLPFLLRCRNIIAFNTNGDYFPLKVYQIRAFLLQRAFRFFSPRPKELLIYLSAWIFLTISTGYIYLRRFLFHLIRIR